MNRSRGFTIVEVVIVVAVLAILTTIATIGVTRYLADTRDSQRVSSVTTISEGLEKYYDQNGEYPSCSDLTGDANTVAQEILGGVSAEVLNAPASAQTNSVSCTTVESSSGDIFEYKGDGSADCLSGGVCLSYTLRFREESTGQIKEVASRRSASIATSGVPDLSLVGSGLQQLTATWNAVPNALNYTVQVSTTSNFAAIAATQTVPGFTANLSGLSYNSPYFARVRANSSDTQGQWSTTANASTLALTAPNVSISPNTATQSTASWTTVSGATSYRLEWTTNTSSWVNNLTTSSTSSPVTGLSGGVLYYYRTRAVWNGNNGPWSTVVSAYTNPGGATTPNISAAMSGTNAVGTASGSTCSSGGTVQYRFRSRSTDTATDGAWSAWTAWAATTTNSVAASQGYKYDFDVESRCMAGSTPSDSSSGSSIASVVRDFPAPSAPTVSASTPSTSTTFTRTSTPTCPGNGTLSYQYKRNREGATYSWTATTSTTISTTSSSQGFQYGIEWQARCSNVHSTGPWSASGAASYIRPVTGPSGWSYDGYRESATVMRLRVSASCLSGASIYGLYDIHTWDWPWVPGDYYGWRRNSLGWASGGTSYYYGQNASILTGTSSYTIPSGSRWNVGGYFTCQNSTTGRNSGANVWQESGIFYAS